MRIWKSLLTVSIFFYEKIITFSLENENKINNSLPKNNNFNKNNNMVEIKEENEKVPIQPNDINFYKLKNSKLFQKFLKEEGQTQKKLINTLIINTFNKNN